VIHALLSNSTYQSTFLQLVTVAMILVVVSVNTATVERSFSDKKLVKTRLRNRLGYTSLDQAMRVSIEGQETLDNENLDCIGNHWKDKNIADFVCNFRAIISKF